MSFSLSSLSLGSLSLSSLSPTISLPSPAYSLFSSFYPSPFYLYLPIPVPSLPPAPLFPFRPQPIFSPPPFTLTLPIYTHSLLPLASLFTPLPCLFPLPPPSDERDEG